MRQGKQFGKESMSGMTEGYRTRMSERKLLGMVRRLVRKMVVNWKVKTKDE